MADQSASTGFSSSLISEVEQGITAVPAEYLAKLAKWMQLDDAEASELALLASLKPRKLRDADQIGDNLLQVLNQLSSSTTDG